jgi:hypothetical protein
MFLSYVTRKQSSTQLLPQHPSRSLRCVADQTFHPVLTPTPPPILTLRMRLKHQYAQNAARIPVISN